MATATDRKLKELVFAYEYLIDLDGPRAAEAAGYARKRAAEILARPTVSRMVQRAMDERIQRLKFDADAVLLDLQHALSRPISTWLKVSEDGKTLHFDFSGATPRDLAWVTEVKADRHGRVTVKGVDRLKVLELIGRHVSVRAWRDTLELDETTTEVLAQRILEGRKRALGAP